MIFIGYGRDDEHVPRLVCEKRFCARWPLARPFMFGQSPSSAGLRDDALILRRAPSGLGLRVEDNPPKTRPVVRPALAECRGVRVSGCDAGRTSSMDGTNLLQWSTNSVVKPGLALREHCIYPPNR